VGIQLRHDQDFAGTLDPLALIVVRFVVMVALSVGVVFGSGTFHRIRRHDWPALLVAGILGIGVYQFCFIFSLQHTSVFASSLLTSVFPLFTMAGATLLGEERPSAARWFGALVALGGIAIFEGLFAGRATFRLGDLLALGASLSFAPYTLVARRLRDRYGPVSFLAITMTIGTVVLVLAGAAAALHQDYAALDRTDWLLFAYIVIFPISIGYALLNWGIARIGAGPASMYAFGVPIVGGLASALVFHTQIPAYEIAGAAVCVGGLAIAQSAPEKAQRN
jgi:drug/metabolite transporter (DMT)-like permease